MGIWDTVVDVASTIFGGTPSDSSFGPVSSGVDYGAWLDAANKPSNFGWGDVIGPELLPGLITAGTTAWGTSAANQLGEQDRQLNRDKFEYEKQIDQQKLAVQQAQIAAQVAAAKLNAIQNAYANLTGAALKGGELQSGAANNMAQLGTAPLLKG